MILCYFAKKSLIVFESYVNTLKFIFLRKIKLIVMGSCLDVIVVIHH